MFSQIVKIQINLYSHREEDNLIIKNLDLENHNNINKHIKKTLYDICSGKETTSVNKGINDEEILKYKNEISMLKNELNTLRNEISSLNNELEVSEKEKELLLIKLKSNTIKTREVKKEIEIPDETPEANTKETPKNKMSNKLLGSLTNINL